jgi:hypothetical protein
MPRRATNKAAEVCGGKIGVAFFEVWDKASEDWRGSIFESGQNGV